jgi:hypothetical protein
MTEFPYIDEARLDFRNMWPRWPSRTRKLPFHQLQSQAVGYIWDVRPPTSGPPLGRGGILR